VCGSRHGSMAWVVVATDRDAKRLADLPVGAVTVAGVGRAVCGSRHGSVVWVGWAVCGGPRQDGLGWVGRVWWPTAGWFGLGGPCVRWPTAGWFGLGGPCVRWPTAGWFGLGGPCAVAHRRMVWVGWADARRSEWLRWGELDYWRSGLRYRCAEREEVVSRVRRRAWQRP
jgi:hypothetical protein